MKQHNEKARSFSLNERLKHDDMKKREDEYIRKLDEINVKRNQREDNISGSLER